MKFKHDVTANSQDSQNSKICLKVKQSISGQKKLRGAGQVKGHCAHFQQKRFASDSTRFVDAHFPQDCSLRMQRQDDHDQLN